MLQFTSTLGHKTANNPVERPASCAARLPLTFDVKGL